MAARSPSIGQVTLASGASTQMPTVRGATGGVAIKAFATNAGVLYISDTTPVTPGNGWPLAAGESIVLGIVQLSKLYYIGTSGDKFAYASVGN
jgi:hypothetical protein